VRRAVALALCLFGLATLAYAADLPPGKWWRRPEVAQRLELSEEQQMRLDDVFRKSAPDLIDLRGAVEKANIALRAELDQPQLDRQRLRVMANRLSDARGRLFERELMMLADMRAVLTDTQWNRLRQLLDRIGDQANRPHLQQRLQRQQGRSPER